MEADERLEVEAEVLGWLKGKLPVPKVYYYDEHEGTEYLLMAEIAGWQAKSPEILSSPSELGRLMGKGLKEIHRLDVSNCPFDQSLGVRIATARHRVTQGLVDEDDFEPEYRGKTAAELLKKIEEGRPGKEDKVFTHGDYSLANLIVGNGKLQGCIDWGRAGVADRHQDLGIAIRTLRNNAGLEAVDAFKEAYGVEWFDSDKIAYFILMDELF
ncbi:MAG TPA: APH(3') family aminoglycoside O-phosphotransferase [Bacillales bacterium]|nr:APH(3') family aminoglycoside O-phosphotransferase [Bacillales bacterium]